MSIENRHLEKIPAQNFGLLDCSPQQRQERFTGTPNQTNGAGGGPMVAGSVDEQVFLQLFEENTPHLQLHSSRDLDMHLTQVSVSSRTRFHPWSEGTD